MTKKLYSFKINNETSNKIVWIQFIASIVIILDHSFNYINFIPNTNFDIIMQFIVYAMGKWATNIVMPMFFAISGFLLFKDIRDFTSENNIKSWYQKKITSRFKTLFIPFVCWNTIWCIFYMILGRIGLTSGNVDTSVSFFNIISGIFYYKYNEVFWYVFALLIYVIISPFLYFVLNNKNIGLISLLIFAVISNIKYSVDVLNILNIFNSIFFFGLGVYIAIHCCELINIDFNKKNYHNCSNMFFNIDSSITFE